MMFDYPAQVWWTVIGRAAESAGLSLTRFERLAGLGSNTLSKHKRNGLSGPRWPTFETVCKVADAALWDRDRLTAEIERTAAELKMDLTHAADLLPTSGDSRDPRQLRLVVSRGRVQHGRPERASPGSCSAGRPPTRASVRA